MDELVKLVAEKTGLSQAQAKTAVTTVISFLKQRLPAPIAAQIDGILAGGGGASSLAGSLGGLLGKK
ncbi:MAG: hypothetical protein ACYC5M_14340 [Anaerolineae bacterium]